MAVKSSTDIAAYCERHVGERLVVLGNGPSWAYQDLSRIDCPVIGLNQAWRFMKCDYLCMGDAPQFEMYEKEEEDKDGTVLFGTENTGAVLPDYAVPVKGIHLSEAGRKRFSLDLELGVYLNHTVASFGIQLAVYMLGWRGTVYLVGIDACGHGVGGKVIPESKLTNQRETLGYIAGFLEGLAPRIYVYNLSPLTASWAFEKKSFAEVFG